MRIHSHSQESSRGGTLPVRHGVHGRTGTRQRHLVIFKKSCFLQKKSAFTLNKSQMLDLCLMSNIVSATPIEKQGLS